MKSLSKSKNVLEAEKEPQKSLIISYKKPDLECNSILLATKKNASHGGCFFCKKKLLVIFL